MKYFLIVLSIAFAGAFLGFEMGRSYCFDLFNRGLIYDESLKIPADIRAGSAYGRVWAGWGGGIGLVVGLAAAVFWKLWWYREPIPFVSALKRIVRRKG